MAKAIIQKYIVQDSKEAINIEWSVRVVGFKYIINTVFLTKYTFSKYSSINKLQVICLDKLKSYAGTY